MREALLQNRPDFVQMAAKRLFTDLLLYKPTGVCYTKINRYKTGRFVR